MPNGHFRNNEDILSSALQFLYTLMRAMLDCILKEILYLYSVNLP